MADDRQQRAGLHELLVEPDVAIDGFYGGDLVGLVEDREARGEAGAQVGEGFAVAAQQAYTKGMKGRDVRPSLDRHAGLFEDVPDARAHFFRSFVGKRDREDRLRRGARAVDEMCDAMDQDPCLPASRSGKDEQGTLGMKNRLALPGVEGSEKVHEGASF